MHAELGSAKNKITFSIFIWSLCAHAERYRFQLQIHGPCPIQWAYQTEVRAHTALWGGLQSPHFMHGTVRKSRQAQECKLNPGIWCEVSQHCILWKHILVSGPGTFTVWISAQVHKLKIQGIPVKSMVQVKLPASNSKAVAQGGIKSSSTTWHRAPLPVGPFSLYSTSHCSSTFPFSGNKGSDALVSCPLTTQPKATPWALATLWGAHRWKLLLGFVPQQPNSLLHKKASPQQPNLCTVVRNSFHMNSSAWHFLPISFSETYCSCLPVVDYTNCKGKAACPGIAVWQIPYCSVLCRIVWSLMGER